MTSEQLEAARAERMRQNGHGALTLEDARTWMEETGLCLFLPKRQFSTSLAPSFVEAVAGQHSATPDSKQIAIAEDLLVRLELEGVAVRLNLLGQPGEQPDYVVAAWVLPYVYALRGDRDWRRSPQLTGSRQVSPLAIQAYKRLESGGDATIAELKQFLGQGVSESAVLRAITELWQQLRIIPIISAPGQPAKWQLLRHRFQKAIAEGASTSQVGAISVLASIYLQAVIAAGMEEVEIFLSPLTARSKVREVLRGLVATRQVHTLSMGHTPHFYVAGTLPEFSIAPTVYASSAMSASSYFTKYQDTDDSYPEPSAPEPAGISATAPLKLDAPSEQVLEESAPVAHNTPVRNGAVRSQAPKGKPAAQRPHFSRPATHTRDRKPAQAAGNGRPARRPADARPGGARPANGNRAAAGTRWSANGSKSSAASRNGNGSHASNGSTNGARSNGNGHSASANGTRGAKPAQPAWKRSGGSANGKSNGSSLNGSRTRSAGPRKDSRSEARPARNNRQPALTAGKSAGNGKRYGFTARPKQGTKKRG